MRLNSLAMFSLGAAVFLMVLAGCRPSSDPPNGYPPATRPPALSAYTGSVDEIIGPDGPVATGFDDSKYRQLRRPDAILPVYHPHFVSAADSNLPGGELVIGLEIHGDARVYPAGLLYHREMVNDTVGGVPVLVTWCPLCYTALVHHRQVNGSAAVFGNQGALYKGAMTWFDHATGSVWSQPLGAAIAGPLAGHSLELMPSQLTTWRRWLAAHPDTRVLAADIPAAPYSGRKPGADHVAGVVLGNQAMAWPYRSVLDSGPIAAEVGGVSVVISADPATGAVRAMTADEDPMDLPVIIAYRWAWAELYPDAPVDKAYPVR